MQRKWTMGANCQCYNICECSPLIVYFRVICQFRYLVLLLLLLVPCPCLVSVHLALFYILSCSFFCILSCSSLCLHYKVGRVPVFVCILFSCKCILFLSSSVLVKTNITYVLITFIQVISILYIFVLLYCTFVSSFIFVLAYKLFFCF